MTQSLGAAVLTVSVDDTQLRAGLLAVQNQAQRTAAIVQQAFAQAAQGQQQAPRAPRSSAPPPPPPGLPPGGRQQPPRPPAPPQSPPPSQQRDVADLLAQRAQLQNRLQRFAVNTAPFDRLVERIRDINQQIEAANRQKLSPGADPRSIDAMRQRVTALTAALNRVAVNTEQFRTLQRDLGGATKELERAEGSTKKASSAFQGIGTALAGLGIGAAVFGFLKGSVTAAAELESISRKLANTLGRQGAGEALAFTRGLSDQLGLSFKSLASAFGSFTAAATAANVPLETQRNLFAAVAKAGQALGLSNFEVEGSLLALQQVASKGTVQMEELRGQLGERLPIALSATALGLGVTQRELIKLVESGQLTADRFFPALTKGLNELTTQAGGIPTAAQNFQRLSNAFDDLQTSFGTSLLPTVIAGVKELTAVLQGMGTVLEANRLGLGGGFRSGGLLGNLLGFLPQESAEAVGRIRAVAEQYKLTIEQTRALFTDSAEQAGLNSTPVGLLGTEEQLNEALNRLPDLARRFRQRNPDLTGEKNAQSAQQQAETQRLLKESEAQQARNRLNTAASLRRLDLEGTNNRINAAQQLATLEGVELIRLQNKLAIQDRILERRRVEVQLADELSKPRGASDGKGGTQSAGRIAELRDELAKSDAQIRGAYIDAGIALVRAAKEAADQLRSAQGGFNDVIRGRSDVFSPQLVQQQLQLARSEFQPLVERGVIRTGIPIGTPEQVFGLASVARQFTQAENTLRLAQAQETAAREAVRNTSALTDNSTAISGLRASIDNLVAKNWDVSVNVQAPSAVLPNI